MSLKIDEIIAIIIVCVFYTVLIGHSIRLYKKRFNRKKKTTDVEARNGTETTGTEESSSLPDPQSSSSSIPTVIDRVGAEAHPSCPASLSSIGAVFALV